MLGFIFDGESIDGWHLDNVAMLAMELVDITVPLNLNFTLASTYSRALTPFHRAVIVIVINDTV